MKFRIRRRVLAGAFALVAATGVLAATPALAAEPRQRIDLRVLVLDDGSTGIDMLRAQLDREGVPYDALGLGDNGRPAITPAFLADSVSGVRRAKFQGVIVPNEGAVTGTEATALADFEREFKIRRLDAYTWANPNVGQDLAWSGVLDGATMNVTDAGKAAGFGYLDGTVRIDDRDPNVIESYGYFGVPAATLPAGATFTPLVTGSMAGAGGSLMGVYTHDGREELVVTLAANRFQTHAMELGHGLVTWLTKGIHLGVTRNFFSVHVDDVFLPDDRWDTTHNCTVGDDCGPGTPANTPIRMTPADVQALIAWQQANGLKLDVAFNGGGSVEAGAGDPLTTAMVNNKTQFRWINHTYEHPYLGCVQDFTVSPWKCATDGYGATKWTSQADITAQIKTNTDWAKGKGITVDAGELVTGEHSGLRTLPQMPADNPNLAPALNATGVKYIASDASREQTARPVGNAVTVPRYPMNIYYNVATKAEEVDEYNWIYTSQADGGSGICANNPASTCITPLGANGFDTYIVPIEARIAYDHLVSTNPAPHYAHQSNLAEDRILYPVLDAVLARYAATYTTATPIVNPKFADTALQNKRQAAWAAALQARSVEAYTLDGKVTIVNRGSGTLDVPVTMPNGTKLITMSVLGIEVTGGNFGDPYGGERSTWRSLTRNASQQLRLGS
ncbi:hypothetical protein ACFO1B_47510 [Dactylosporangium siamense]|uniref:Uncharacterized protein n=1 Tax=Dactylosporangium siamense TaxID=685454 RepID=A0A919PUG3_9ACTN|nr:hypothetical protein [Dactylosporangium siamense]GIG50414.1 hypothetical protein Dsi01nite_084550 [Dactylosporangium siamense]